MMTPLRYVFLVLGLLLAIHFILTLSHEQYSRATSLDTLRKGLGGSTPPYKTTPHPPSVVWDEATHSNRTRRANAAFVVLARNEDLKGILSSMKQMEDRFNSKFGYPWVFLNEKPFSEEFKKYTSEVATSKTTYGVIPNDHWYQPSWIDEDKAKKVRVQMDRDGVIYGGSLSYRNMCRFNSGFFFRHELLKDFKYYWRVEPDVSYFCDLDYDPFLVMQDQHKVYGFTLSLFEYEATIPTLWSAVREFITQYPQYLAPGNAMNFLSDNGGETYNRCHFWSNFEIGDLDFWRGEAYMNFFDFLDQKGGFYYERWGDAPVHSIAAALFAKKEEIHFFQDIGYRHNPFQHCPQGEIHTRGKCWCDPRDNFGVFILFIVANAVDTGSSDYNGYSCTKKYDELFR